MNLQRKKNKKIALIIGISGQDGAYLARFLLKKDYIVYGTSRDHEITSFSNLVRLGIRNQVKLDSMIASDFRSTLTALKQAKADEIYNLAGQTSVGRSFTYPVETFESILGGTMNLLECIRILKYSVRFYNAGSSEVFGNTQKPASEKTPFSPRSPYAAAKAAAHYLVANYRDAYNLFACTGILFNHESPLRPERFVTQKIISTAARIAQGSKEKLELGRIDIKRDWGWAPDYVEAMQKMLQTKQPADYVIATGASHSLENFICKTFNFLGLDYKQYIKINKNLFRPSDILNSCGNPTNANQNLNWKTEKSLESIIKLLLREKINNNVGFKLQK